MAKYNWKIEPKDEDWSDDLYGYYLIHINLKKMAEYLTKEFKKDWWFKASYGQDYCWIVAENNNYPVRLFFEFEEGGWADVKRHYIDGASYTDEILNSWHFAKYDIDYSFGILKDIIENYFDKFEESVIKEEVEYMTLQDAWNNNNKDLFLSMIYWLEAQRKITYKEAKNLKEVYDNWEDYKDENPDATIKFGNLIVPVEKLKSPKKSLKEYRTVGFEQSVRDTIVDILEDNDADDLFDLGMCNEVIMTYDNEGRAEVRSNGDVLIDYLTLPTYAWSSGYRPQNKKLEKLFDDMMEANFESARELMWHEYKDELIALGITGEDDKNLEYYALYDMGAGNLAEKLSEYEMDMEGMDLYTVVYCTIDEVDEGVGLTVTMSVEDAYGHALVKDYKSNTVVLNEDELQDEDDLREAIEDAIKVVTKQF